MAPTSVTIFIKVTRTMTSNVQNNEEGDRIDERWPILHVVRQRRGDFTGQHRADNERLMKPAVRNDLRFFSVVRHVDNSRNIYILYSQQME